MRDGYSTKISSLPNWLLTNWARELILDESVTSSWWKRTRSEKGKSLSFSIASRPLFSFLAVKTTVIPCEANCLQISNPIPLFAPVTTAYLPKFHNNRFRFYKKEKNPKKFAFLGSNYLFSALLLATAAMDDSGVCSLDGLLQETIFKWKNGHFVASWISKKTSFYFEFSWKCHFLWKQHVAKEKKREISGIEWIKIRQFPFFFFSF